MERIVNWMSVYFREHDGYGHSALEMVRALDAAGLDIRYRTQQGGMDRTLPGEMRDIIRGIHTKGVHEAPVVIYYAIPTMFPETDAYQIGFTQFETSRMPEHYVEPINRMQEAWTTCTGVKQTLLDSGVEVPVYVVPLGVRADRFPRKKRVKSDPFFFVHSGMPEPRKGHDLVLSAYRLAFGGREDKVRLVFKGMGIPDDLHRRMPVGVEFALGRYPAPRLVDLLHQCHCMVYPSSGEGWGMIPLEAISTGLPTILTPYLGMEAFAHLGIPLEYSMQKAEYYEHMMPCGDWAKPSLEDIAAKMLDVYENYEEHAERAYENAGRAAVEFSWERSAEAMLGHLERIWA